MLLRTGKNRIERSALSKAIGLLSLALLLGTIGCDPGQFPNAANQQILNQQRLNSQFVTGRVAVVGCRAGATPVINPTNGSFAKDGNPQLATQIASGVPTGVATFRVLDINESPSYNFSSGVLGSASTNSVTLGTGRLVRQEVQFGEDPSDAVFTAEGLLAVSVKDSIGFFTVTENGVVSFRHQIVASRPTQMAVSQINGRSYLFALVENGTAYLIVDLNEIGADGFPDANPIGLRQITPIRTAMRGLDLVVGPSMAQPDEDSLYIAANNGGTLTVDIETALRNRHALPGDIFAVGNDLHPNQIHQGTVARTRRASPRTDLLAVGSLGEIWGNNVSTGPFGPIGEDGTYRGTPFQDAAWYGSNVGIERIQPNSVKELRVTKDGNNLVALTSNRLFQFDAGAALDGIDGFSYVPIRLASGAKATDMDMDPEGHFFLVADPGTQGVHVVRVRSTGELSYNDRNDLISMRNQCIDPAVVAVKPRSVRYTVTPTPSAPQPAAAAPEA